VCVVERICDDHNYSAILRTAEALGIQHLWIVAPPSSVGNDGDGDDGGGDDDDDDAAGVSKGHLRRHSSPSDASASRSHFLYARKAAEWLSVREFSNSQECLSALRSDGRTVWATDLSQEAVPLTRTGIRTAGIGGEADPDGGLLPCRLAVVFGSESVGCSEEMLSGADARVYLPLVGMADSLNVSVAAALCLQRLLDLSPGCIGHMDEDDRTELRKKWYVKMASQRLITRKDKKNIALLEGKVRAGAEVSRKAASGYSPHPEEIEKAERGEKAAVELGKLRATLHERAVGVVAEFVEQPVKPFGDMRRPDAHRISFCGKGARKKNEGYWGDIPTSKGEVKAVQGRAAEEFRARVTMVKEDSHRKGV